MVVEEHQNPADPGQTSASVTIIPVDGTLSASDDVASVVESASGTVVRRLGGLGDYATISIRGSSARFGMARRRGPPPQSVAFELCVRRLFVLQTRPTFGSRQVSQRREARARRTYMVLRIERGSVRK